MQVEAGVKSSGGPNPLAFKKLRDDVWIGVKFQSNPEIAGSPRNSFRASLKRSIVGVEH